MANEAKPVPGWAMTAAREVGIAGHLPTVHLRIARALLAAERRAIERAANAASPNVGAGIFTEYENGRRDAAAAIRQLGDTP